MRVENGVFGVTYLLSVILICYYCVHSYDICVSAGESSRHRTSRGQRTLKRQFSPPPCVPGIKRGLYRQQAHVTEISNFSSHRGWTDNR